MLRFEDEMENMLNS